MAGAGCIRTEGASCRQGDGQLAVSDLKEPPETMARRLAVIGRSQLYGVNDVARRPPVSSRSRLYVDSEIARRPAVIGRSRLYHQ